MDMQTTLKMSAGLLISILITGLLAEASGALALYYAILFMSGLLLTLFYWAVICYLADRSIQEARIIAYESKEDMEDLEIQVEKKTSMLHDALTSSDMNQSVSQIMPE